MRDTRLVVWTRPKDHERRTQEQRVKRTPISVNRVGEVATHVGFGDIQIRNAARIVDVTPEPCAGGSEEERDQTDYSQDRGVSYTRACFHGGPVWPLRARPHGAISALTPS